MSVAQFIDAQGAVVRVRIAQVDGSSPREVGAEMLVAAKAMHGTIGGGQLEYMALDEARRMLRSGEHASDMTVPLGPEIGQCCGGRVELALAQVDEMMRAALLQAEKREQGKRPDVLVFGAGHVGRALAKALDLLPVSARLIDSRAAELSRAECRDKRLTALPEMELHTARYGSVYIVATHDHALDFLLAAEALKRGDAAYVGMIGSKTKRAKFAGWMRAHEPGADIAPLTCPMGAAGLGDKRPEVIAAHVVSEVLLAVEAHETIQLSMESEA